MHVTNNKALGFQETSALLSISSDMHQSVFAVNNQLPKYSIYHVITKSTLPAKSEADGESLKVKLCVVKGEENSGTGNEGGQYPFVRNSRAVF